ncbi:hypothetical protein SAMN06295945_1462 [Polynucleobacter meluiroseus]|uniref:Glycosyl transferase family 8 n=1 Tax=Polynucleobacter meluiroseus TaxID=1938814 RepID=A0A240E0X7_9BURK|nr:DUF6492 family protein [Polynucleobacter meluiroseus]SNX29098.1 hypothetical protein SAMN06295945_1462 [Polynucleobacter meluiroseus]
MKPHIDQLISVCSKKDAATWKIASPYIAKNISSSIYSVIVPEDEIEFFKNISPSSFNVIGESLLADQFSGEIKSRLSEKTKSQYGWYLQQFLKLAAANDCLPNETVLIWDADTIPLKPLTFMDEKSRLIFYQSDEYHQPYFDFISRLLGLEKKVAFSFIAQCFVMKAAWLQQFCNELEIKYQKPWIKVLLENINFDEGNGFSEYETLGTYFSYHYADSIAFTKNKWLRLGNSTVGSAVFLSPKLIKKKLSLYDFVSFEKWDKAKPYFLKVTAPFFLKVFLPSLFKFNSKT